MSSEQNSIELQKTLENNLRASTQFYNADSQLSTEERKKLANVFWNQSTWVPLGSLPFLIAGIQGARYAGRMGWLGKSPNAGRGLSVFTGLFGLLFGARVSQNLGYAYGQSALSQQPNAQTTFTILGIYPPQIGLAYYRRTSRDPSLAMQDPSTIDWSKEPLFPLNLAVHRSELPRGAHIPGQLVEINRDISKPKPPIAANDNSESSFDGDDEPKPTNPTTTTTQSSWDKVRTSKSNSGSSWDAIRRGETPTRIIPPPVVRTSPESETESQEDFDLEVERERLGQGVQDDFSESEKKWT